MRAKIEATLTALQEELHRHDKLQDCQNNVFKKRSIKNPFHATSVGMCCEYTCDFADQLDKASDEVYSEEDHADELSDLGKDKIDFAREISNIHSQFEKDGVPPAIKEYCERLQAYMNVLFDKQSKYLREHKPQAAPAARMSGGH
ncbi:MAG: hypothetical protein COB66_08680 [Coxiella sp. (in: Bacteria)]|nr:MAG: hypothetical protein COB66_08680 [Coxiella sp. (in: g-proteobacteria)]